MKNIRLFLTDCDGCLTDGGMYYTESGDEMKKFNTKDGMGFELLRQRGILIGIITGEETTITANRAKKIKADILMQGVSNKLDTVTDICHERGINLSDVAYVGDDINDLDLIRNVGFGCTVNNAMECIKAEAVYISPFDGGDGAVRDIIEWLLRSD